jgi:hypothetical protein
MPAKFVQNDVPNPVRYLLAEKAASVSQIFKSITLMDLQVSFISGNYYAFGPQRAIMRLVSHYSNNTRCTHGFSESRQQYFFAVNARL